MKWIVGVSIFAIAMGWAATATIPAATVSIDEATLKYLPPETQGVAYIDVAALRNAALVKDFLDSYRPTIEGRLPEFMTATGFDPQRDVEHITIGKINSTQTVAIVKAKYDQLRVEQFLKDKGTASESYRGRSLYHFDVQRGETYGPGAVAFVDNQIIAGQEDAVKATLDQMSLPAAPTLRTELMDAIRTIDAGSQVWGVGDVSIGDLTSAGVRGPAPALEMLKTLRGGTYQMKIDTGIHAQATGRFADDDSAKNLRDLVRGAIAVAKLQVARQQPDLLHLLDGIQVSTEGTTLLVKVDESGDLLKTLQSLRTAKRN